MTAICFMKKTNGMMCGSMVYRCPNCGAIGCAREGCRNQNWVNFRCAQCGGMKREIPK